MEKQERQRVGEHSSGIRTDQLEAENQELLALTKQAFVKREVEKEVVPVDEEWEKFAAEHAEELEALTPKVAAIFSLFALPSSLRKMAAGIIGILFTAGMAFAAIHIVRNYVEGDLKSPAQETRISNSHQPIASADTIKTDTATHTKPIVFDNVALDMMLSQIAAYYSIGDCKSPITVVFQNVGARQLRFYFVWKQDEPLDVVLHRLNLFESITVELKENKIVVE